MKGVWELDTLFSDNYFGLIRNLSPEIKLDLIEKLSNTLKSDLITKRNPLMDAFGAWESKKSAEDIINEIQNSRNFNRQIEPFVWNDKTVE